MASWVMQRKRKKKKEKNLLEIQYKEHYSIPTVLVEFFQRNFTVKTCIDAGGKEGNVWIWVERYDLLMHALERSLHFSGEEKIKGVYIFMVYALHFFYLLLFGPRELYERLKKNTIFVMESLGRYCLKIYRWEWSFLILQSYGILSVERAFLMNGDWIYGLFKKRSKSFLLNFSENKSFILVRE